MPVRLISRVRGMGVAVRVSTSTSAFSRLIDSLWVTPKRCSSSTTSRPRRLKRDVLAEEAVGADDDVDRAVLHPVDHLLGLAGGEEAAEDLDPHRVAGEALAEGQAVLLGEEGGGDEDGHLHAVLHGLERGPDGDLGLAEADVAAHEAVHRARRLHVGLDVGDGPLLVGRLPVGEGLLELALPRGVGGEGVARGGDALLVEDHQLLGDLAGGRADPALGLGEVGAPEAVEGGRLARRCSGGRRRSGRRGRRACRRPGTRGGGSPARRRRWPG